MEDMEPKSVFDKPIFDPNHPFDPEWAKYTMLANIQKWDDDALRKFYDSSMNPDWENYCPRCGRKFQRSFCGGCGRRRQVIFGDL
jgi:hypothetical protein